MINDSEIKEEGTTFFININNKKTFRILKFSRKSYGAISYLFEVLCKVEEEEICLQKFYSEDKAKKYIKKLISLEDF